MRLEGIIIFDNSLPVVEDCINREISINIGSVPGVFATPRHIDDYHKGPPTSNDWRILLQPENAGGRLRQDIYWGACMGWPEGYSELKRCSIWFTVNDNEAREVGQHIFN